MVIEMYHITFSYQRHQRIKNAGQLFAFASGKFPATWGEDSGIDLLIIGVVVFMARDYDIDCR